MLLESPKMIPARQDPEALMIYAKDWVDDANDRFSIGMRAMAQESLRTAMMMYMRLPPGYSNPEFEQYYQETSKRIYS
jgi:hypothetical protein